MKVSLAIQSFLAATLCGSFPHVASGESLVLPCNFEFGFFGDVTLTEPSKEDVDALLVRTTAWYTQQLQTTLPGLDSFQAVYVGVTYDADPDASEPIVIDFDAKASFSEAGLLAANASAPELSDLFSAMEGADYADYIMTVVWTSDMTGGVFDDVQRVMFNERTSDGEEGTANSEGDEEEDEGDLNCAEALQEYQASDGGTYTEVSLQCLESCAGPPARPALQGRAGNAKEAISCNFTEHKARSTWSDCVTNKSETTEALGTSLTFSADQWMSGRPLVDNLSENYTFVSWGVTRGCGQDKHMYVLYRNTDNGNDEDMYQVVGYKTLDSLESDSAIEGQAAIMGEAISGIGPEPDACAYGNSQDIELYGSCQLTGTHSGNDEPANGEPGKLADMFENSGGSAVFQRTSFALASLSFLLLGF